MAAAVGVPRPLLMSINCMKLQEPRAVYSHILAGIAQAQQSATAAADAIESIVCDDSEEEEEEGAEEGEGAGLPDEIVRPLMLGKVSKGAEPLAQLRRLMLQRGGGGERRGLLVLVLDEIDQLLSGDKYEVRQADSCLIPNTKCGL